MLLPLQLNGLNLDTTVHTELAYDFAADKTLVGSSGPTLSIARASDATYFDSAGVIQTASSNVARFDHDPLTLESLGLLIEESRSNLVTHSNAMENWSSVSDSIDAAAGIAPDGTNTYARLNVAVSAASHFAFSAQMTTVSGTIYCASCYLKSDGARYAGISFADAAENHISILADLQEGKITAIDVGATSGTLTTNISSYDIEDIGNGEYRLWIAGSTTGAGTTFMYVYGADSPIPVFDDTGQADYTPVEGDDILMWGAQFEEGSTPSSIIPTTTAAVTREADLISTTDVSWYDSTGTFTVDFDYPRNFMSSRVFMEVSDNSTSDRHLMYIPAGTRNADSFIASGGVTQVNLQQTLLTPSRRTRMALSYAANDVESYVNGDRTGTGDQVATMPVGISQLNLGTTFSNVSSLESHIRTLTYSPASSSLAELVVLTDFVITALVVGDSFTDESYDWPMLIDQRAVSLGVPANTLVSDIEPTFAADLAAADATTTTVYIAGGVADIIADETLVNMQTAINSMITTAKAANLDIYIIGIGPWTNYTSWSAARQVVTDNYNAWLSEQASIQGFAYVDIYTELEGPDDELSAVYDSGDGLHPNYHGQQVIARLISGTAAAAAVSRKGGRSGKKRYVVEVDGELFQVSSISEAESVLQRVRDLANESAERDVRTDVVPKPPRVSIRTISGAKTTSKVLQAQVKRTQKAINTAYTTVANRFAQDKEIAKLLISKLEKQELEDEEAILVLLL